MSANASANSSNASAKNAGNVAVANAKNSSAKNAGNVVNTSANAKNASNVAAANGNVAVKNANKPSGGVLGALGSIFGAKPAANAANVAANKPANNKPANAAAAEVALNAPAANAKARARTLRRQRGGARGKTMRLPGPRNVLRVTGKTVGKIRNVGVYGLKKVGNGVHMVTGLLGAGTKLVGSVLRKGGKTLKGLTKRRQQTRKQ